LQRITGTNCGAAVIFGDNDAAEKTLEGLRTETHIESARYISRMGLFLLNSLGIQIKTEKR
jgi:hypothetical protein